MTNHVARPRVRFLATLAAALLPLSCVHLLQPQTYYLATDRVAQQREEYLAKELVAGLPEDLFKRWYTRDAAWTDDLRPYILAVQAGDPEGRTVYEVGSGGRTIAEVVFRAGRLEEVGGWRLRQESLVSAWSHERGAPPRAATDAMLDRLARLDPLSEPLRPEEIPGREAVCRLESGTVVETLQPMSIRRQKGQRHARLEMAAPGGGGAPGDPGLLPSMTKLVIKRWREIGTARLVDPKDRQEYLLSPSDGNLCPAGECAPPGAAAVVTRDLVVAVDREGTKTAAIAVVPAQRRIPVWMDRPGVLRAGTPVRLVSWYPCRTMTAEIEVVSAERLGLPERLRVPIAPPGLFSRTVTASPGAPAPSSPGAAGPAPGSATF